MQKYEVKDLKEYEFPYIILAQTIANIPVKGHKNCWSCIHNKNLNKVLPKYEIYLDAVNPEYDSYNYRNESGDIETRLLCFNCEIRLQKQNEKLQKVFYKK